MEKWECGEKNEENEGREMGRWREWGWGEKKGKEEKKIGSGNKNGDRDEEIRKRGDEMMDEKGVWCENSEVWVSAEGKSRASAVWGICNVGQLRPLLL